MWFSQFSGIFNRSKPSSHITIPLLNTYADVIKLTKIVLFFRPNICYQREQNTSSRSSVMNSALRPNVY